MDTYKLVNKTPIKCSFEESAQSKRKIASDSFGEVLVSTVFLPFDHSFGNGEPVLFETLVFGGPHDGYMLRYHTYDEAIKGHSEVCYMINKISIDRDSKLNELGF